MPKNKYLKEIHEVLKKRGKEWPHRGKSFYKFKHKTHEFYKYLKENKNFTPEKIDIKLIENIQKIKDRAVFICGNLKSGTTLVSQLLDNHDNLFSLPGDSHFVSAFYNLSTDKADEICEYWLARIINPTGQEPFFPYGQTVELYQTFVNFFHYFIKKNKKINFKFIVLSFIASVMPEKLHNLKYWIEKTPLNELQTKKILSAFPDAKFINITRNPVLNIISLKRLDKIRNRKSYIIQKSVFQVYITKKALENQKNIKTYKIISYEDLTDDLQKTMKDISLFLDIDFSNTMLTPSVNGIPATANSMYEKKRKKGIVIKQNNEKEKLSELSIKEKIMLVNILSIHKPYHKFLLSNYPELSKYIKQLYIFMAKLVYFLYQIYRKTVK